MRMKVHARELREGDRLVYRRGGRGWSRERLFPVVAAWVGSVEGEEQPVVVIQLGSEFQNIEPNVAMERPEKWVEIERAIGVDDAIASGALVRYGGDCLTCEGNFTLAARCDYCGRSDIVALYARADEVPDEPEGPAVVRRRDGDARDAAGDVNTGGLL